MYNFLNGVFETKEFLVGALIEFITAGLAANEGILLFVSPAHAVFLKEHFAFAIPDYQQYVQRKQIHFLDASQAIKFFVIDGKFSEEKFKLLIGSSLSDMKGRFNRLRMYSEMGQLIRAHGKNLTREIETAKLKFLEAREDLTVLRGFYKPDPFSDEIPGGDYLTLNQESPAFEKEIDFGKFQMKLLLDKQKDREYSGLQDMISDLKNQLIQGLKNRQIGELMSSISQEFINPITILHGNTNILKMLLKDDSISKADILRYLDSSAEATKRLERFTKNLIQLTKKAGPLDRPVSTTELIDCIIEVTRPFLQETNIALEFDRAPQQHYPKISIPEFTQIILNLMINARDAINSVRSIGSGRIKISESCLSDSLMMITVTDNGVGIAKEDTDKVFKPYHSFKKQKGIGFGLYLSHSILREQGGKISFESREGVGTTFTVQIPI